MEDLASAARQFEVKDVTGSPIVRRDDVPDFAELTADLGREPSALEVFNSILTPDIVDALVDSTNKNIADRLRQGKFERWTSTGYTNAAGTAGKKIRYSMSDVNADDIRDFIIDYAFDAMGCPTHLLSTSRFIFIRANLSVPHHAFTDLLLDSLTAVVVPGFMFAIDDVLYRALGLKDVGISIPAKPAQYGLYFDAIAQYLLLSRCPIYFALNPHLTPGQKAPTHRSAAGLAALLRNKTGDNATSSQDRGFGCFDGLEALAAIGQRAVVSMTTEALGTGLADLLLHGLGLGHSRTFQIRTPNGVDAIASAHRTNEKSSFLVVSTSHRVKPAAAETASPAPELALLRNAFNLLRDQPPYIRTIIANATGFKLPGGGADMEALALVGLSASELLLLDPTSSSSSSAVVEPNTQDGERASTVSAQLAEAERLGAAEARADADSGGGGGMGTRNQRSSKKYTPEQLKAMTLDQLKLLCKDAKLHVTKLKGTPKSQAKNKHDYIRALIRAQNVLESDADERLVDELTKSSTKGLATIHEAYKNTFKPVDVADQIKSFLTVPTRRPGSAEHVAALHFVLILWTNMYAVHQESRFRASTSLVKRQSLKNWFNINQKLFKKS